MKILLPTFLDKVFIKWFLVGTFSFYLDYTIFIFLYTQTPFGKFVSFCNALSMGTATLVNFLLHNFWTFKSQKSLSSNLYPYLANFVAIWIVGTLFLKALIVAGLAPNFAKPSSALLTLPISYLTLRIHVFGTKKNHNAESTS